MIRYTDPHGGARAADAVDGEDLAATIYQIMEFPRTDDPVDTLCQIAELLGSSDYDYFDGRGQWVGYR